MAGKNGSPDQCGVSGSDDAGDALARLVDRPPPQVFQCRLCLRRFLSIFLLGFLSVVLLWVAMPPFDLWYLAYVALVPWAMAMAPGVHGRWQVFCGWLTGMVWWGGNLNWLTWITPEGDIAAVVYLSVYVLIATLMLRAALRRNWPIWLVLPILWTSLEFAWSHVVPFPWFGLAHTQHAQVRLIQIADVTGQYGVSFFVAMVNGALVDVLITPLFKRCAAGPGVFRLRIVAGPAASIVVAAALLGYGTFRLIQFETAATTPGPRVGVVQHAFGISLNKPDARPLKMFNAHMESIDAFVGRGCDLVVVPETMFVPGLNDACIQYLAEEKNENVVALRALRERIADASHRVGCPILAGGLAYVPVRSTDGGDDTIIRYNSAMLFDARGDQLARYDKRHLVPFSEYVPFGDSWPALHRLLRSFVPESMPQITPGKNPGPIRLVRGRRAWNLVTPICFEGTIPDVCRKLVFRDGQKLPHLVMINLSNDGWFVYQRYVGKIDGEVTKAIPRADRRVVGSRVIFEAADGALTDIWPDTKLLIHRGSDWVGELRVLEVSGARLTGEVVYARAPIEPGDRLCRSVRMYHSTEQAQHLAHYVFRAIENRVPVVRAVNTGISASIDSAGRKQVVLERNGRRVMAVGTMIVGSREALPPDTRPKSAPIYGGKVLVDDRVTLYSHVGDVFAVCVCAAAAVLLAMPVLRRGRPDQETPK